MSLILQNSRFLSHASPRRQRATNKRHGSVLALTALGLITMLGCCALAADYGLLVGDANKLQRALDAAALAGAQDLKQSRNQDDEAKARDSATAAAAQNGIRINKDSDVSFSNNSTRITVRGSARRLYLFARIFNLVTPGSGNSGTVSRIASARVASCSALDTTRVSPIGITWDTYGGTDWSGKNYPDGYQNDGIENQKLLDQPDRMIFRTLNLTRQNQTVFEKDDFVLFDLRNSPSKSGAHFQRQITNDATARALSSLGDYETSLNASDHAQGGFLGGAFETIFQRAAQAPFNDASATPFLNADGNKYADILAGNSPVDRQGKPNPRIMSLVIVPAPVNAPINGSWEAQVQGYAPVYVKRIYSTVDPILDPVTGETLSTETVWKMDVGFLPPANNSNGACIAGDGTNITGQRIIGLVQ